MDNPGWPCTYCKLPYTACVQSRFPSTVTAIFQATADDGDLGNSAIVQQIENDPLVQDWNIGTQQPAKGDSGNGNWMENSGRSVLVGITTLIRKPIPAMIQKTTNPEIFEFITNTITY